jgi:long-subunit acyl-CoA synthetase (AMP-forming)
MPTVTDDQLLLQRFYKHCSERPNDIYMHQPYDGGQVDTYTWSQVLDSARRLANFLKAKGYEPQTKIALISKNCYQFIITDLAIWMAGHVSVALYPTLNSGTVNYILGHSDSKLAFIGKLDSFDEIKKGLPADLECIAFPNAPAGPKSAYASWADIVSSTEPIEGNPVRDADDEALIIYTSGSTGQPKGVLHSFRTISTPTVGLVEMLNVGPQDRALSYLPLAHGMDRWLSECVSLYAGSQLYFAESLKTFVTDLGRAKPTIFVSVPRLWLKFQLGVFSKMPKKKLDTFLKIPILRGIVKKKILGNLGLDSVRFAGSGSAPIPAELLTWYRNLGLELLEGYGMSENFNYSHITVPGKGKAGYIGHPYPDVHCKISDAGEILVKSPGTMVGYYKAPELTAQTMTEDGYLKTGDRGTIDSTGLLRITGRIKELFKTSKGKYVAPAPIENLINTDTRIELSLVAGNGQVSTHAVVQLAEDLLPKLNEAGVKEQVTKALENLLDDINGKIEAYEKLGFIVIAKDRWTIEDGHLTPTMKIRRTAIETQYEANMENWYGAGKKVIWE